jgi:hypothetical protein
MRRDNLKISVKVDDFIDALAAKRDKEIKDFERYKKKYKNESSKHYKITADKIRRLADKIESGIIPQGVDRNSYREKETLVIPVNLMKLPHEPDTNSINSLIKALKISSSKTISLEKWEYENYFSDNLDE